MKKLDFSLQNKITEWCLSSTTHGIPNIVRSKNKLSAIFWLVAFLASTIFCGYQIVQILIDVSTYPVYVNIDVIEEMPAPFPSISFCNLNPFNTVNPSVYAIFENILSDNKLNYNRPPNLVWLSASGLIKSFVHDLSNDEKQNFTIDFYQMVYNCKFNGFLCNKEDFEWFYDFDYGNCYKFNPYGTRFVGKSGSQSGLRLEIYVGNSTGKEAYSISRGVRFLVHNHSDTICINDFGEEAAAGFSTQVIISRSVYEKLDQPFSTCLSDLTRSNSKQTKIMRTMFNQLNFKKYSKEICLNICFQLKLENKCNCSDPSIASIQNMTKCNSIKQIKCKEEFYQSFFSNQSQECEDDCPIECVTYKYSTKLTFSEFYTNWYFDLFQNRKNGIEKDIGSYGSAEVARKNVLLINFYYDETSITKIKEKPLWNFFSILSSIGGNLGLFIGMSILSCAEITEIIVKTIFLNFKHTLKMNKLEFVEKISSK